MEEAEAVQRAITTLDVALVILRLLAVALVGGFVGGVVLWRSAIWSDETVGEDDTNGSEA